MTSLSMVRPEHVPGELVRDFNFHDFPGLKQDPYRAWREVQESYPEIFWTPHQGGHWVVTRFDDIQEILRDYETFSNEEPFIPVRPNAKRLTPVQNDPPEHTAMRKLLMPGFLPREITKIEAGARAIAVGIIETLAPRGECEFVSEFASAMPIAVFLGMMGLPQEDAPYLREVLKYTQQVDKVDGFQKFTDYLANWIDRRIADPGDDLISKVVVGQVDGRPLTRDEIDSMCLLLLTGGLDTVVAMISHMARFLAENPQVRTDLLAEPEISNRQLDELIRRTGVTNVARMVAKDTIYGGVVMRRGEQVLLPTFLAGLDDRKNAEPMEVDFSRTVPHHLAFGYGAHTCIGATLARREMKAFLEEWLKRIPDFSIKPGSAPDIHAGTVNTMNELWLCWDPATTSVPTTK